MARKSDSLVEKLRKRKLAVAKEANRVGNMKKTRNIGNQRITLPRMSWEMDEKELEQ